MKRQLERPYGFGRNDAASCATCKFSKKFFGKYTVCARMPEQVIQDPGEYKCYRYVREKTFDHVLKKRIEYSPFDKCAVCNGVNSRECDNCKGSGVELPIVFRK